MGGLWLVLIWYLKLKVLFFLFRRALAGHNAPALYTYLVVYLYRVTGDGLSFWMGGTRLFPA